MINQFGASNIQSKIITTFKAFSTYLHLQDRIEETPMLLKLVDENSEMDSI